MPPRRANIGITWTRIEKEAVAMALCNLQVKWVASHYNLTEGQLYYRINKLKFQELRRGFKTNDSPIAKRVISTNLKYAMQYVTHQIVELNSRPGVKLTKRSQRNGKA